MEGSLKPAPGTLENGIGTKQEKNPASNEEAQQEGLSGLPDKIAEGKSYDDHRLNRLRIIAHGVHRIYTGGSLGRTPGSQKRCGKHDQEIKTHHLRM